LLRDILICSGPYPDETMRLMFDRPTPLLKHWDELNKTRKLVGIAANDAHQNVGIRAVYTANDTLLLTTPAGDDDKIGEWKLNFFSRGALRLVFGKLEPGKEFYRYQVDPYERSVRFVNTHILARECTTDGLLDGLRQGRVFVGFDLLADARGFTYLAEAPPVGTSASRRVVMGESMPYEKGLKLRMASPEPCRFTILRDGTQVSQSTGTVCDYEAPGPGKYRVEAELEILGEWTPWVYTNPIEITGAAAGSAS